MKKITLFSLTALSFLTVSCSNESKSMDEKEIEVKVADETPDGHMAAGKKLDVKVVNELDPICGMDNATHLKDTANYKGNTYGFCNTMCKEKFLEHPEQYVNE